MPLPEEGGGRWCTGRAPQRPQPAPAASLGRWPPSAWPAGLERHRVTASRVNTEGRSQTLATLTPNSPAKKTVSRIPLYGETRCVAPGRQAGCSRIGARTRALLVLPCSQAQV